MRKNIIMLVIMISLSLCLVACGKKAAPIVLPPTEEITSIEIANGIEDIISTKKEVITAFMQKVVEAQPTAKESVQDVPDALKYTRVDLVHNGEISSLFIYQENSKWYIEQPYWGIYETDEAILGLIEND